MGQTMHQSGQDTEPITSIDGEWVTTFEPLDADECWELIGVAAATGVGRVGFDAGRGPEVLPVNFAVARRSIVVRTAGSTALHRLGTGADVAFEVDHLQPGPRTGWSVVVHGRMWPLQDPQRLLTGDVAHLHPWAAGERDQWLRIVPGAVTGRAICRRRIPSDGVDLPYMLPD
jgi:nitroimidazol reductase NimA-like FMN-containing flavoprotein (pyridoxamine 5'-phosphate oxidase superfamily)